MQARKAARVIDGIIADKRIALKEVEVRRWTERMKEDARKMLREDIAALGLARATLSELSRWPVPRAKSKD